MRDAPLTLHGRFNGGFGWMPDPGEFMLRSSTALVSGGRVWLIDPLRTPGIDDELAKLGKMAGVILTLLRHDRDAAWFANLHGVPVYVPRNLGTSHVNAPVEPVDDAVPDSPFRLLAANAGRWFAWWRESLVWWPEERTLVAGDLFGTASYFILPGERLGVHPLRRLAPPLELRDLQPERIFCGHGLSLHDSVPEAMRQAVQTARGNLPRAWWAALRTTIRSDM